MSGDAARVVTFGCRLNATDSAAISALAEREEMRDCVVINGCAVTSEAMRQARQAARRAKRENPTRRVAVAGCAARVDPDAFARMESVDLVLGHREKFDPRCYVPASSRRPVDKIRVDSSSRPYVSPSPRADAFGDRARAFLEIQSGCDHRCTFCVIPFARGSSRSLSPSEAVDRARRACEAGRRELVLTGVDIASYGRDLAGSPTLGVLVRRILRDVPRLERLRLSSLDCALEDSELMRAIAEEERLMPHFHLSLQSGNALILKRMRRRHSPADAERLCDRIRRLRPEATFGADFIVGFPTETEAMFADTSRHAARCGADRVHAFPYSRRPGTSASRMPRAASRVEAKSRAERLRSEASARLAAWSAGQIGRVQTLRMESPRSGRTIHDVRMRLTSGAASESGATARARTVGTLDGSLAGVLLG